MSRFSFTPIRHCRDSLRQKSHRCGVCSACSADPNLRFPPAGTCRHSSCLFSPSVFVRQARLQLWLFAFLSRTSSSTVSSRKWLVMFLCPSHLCMCSKPQASFLRLPLDSLWVPPSHLQVLIVLHVEEREVRVQEGCPLSSSSVSVVSRQVLERFPSAQLCSASRRTLRAYSIVGSDQMPAREVALVQPHGGIPLVRQLRRGIPRSFSHLWKVSKHKFTKFQQLSTIRTTHCPIEQGLYIVSLEARNKPRCMSNNPCHQYTVSGWSVFRAVLKCCQHCAHLSLHMFLMVFHCSVALDVIVWENFG